MERCTGSVTMNAALSVDTAGTNKHFLLYFKSKKNYLKKLHDIFKCSTLKVSAQTD